MTADPSLNGNVPLFDFFDRILEEHEKAHNAQHVAVELAAKDLERRLDGLNELRAEVVQDRSQYLLASTYDAKHQALIDRLERIALGVEERRELLEKAVNIHFESHDKRLVGIEKSLAADYMTKDAINALHEVGSSRLDDENTRIAALEQKSISAEALNTYKRLVYGTLIGAGITFGIALFNLVTKS